MSQKTGCIYLLRPQKNLCRKIFNQKLNIIYKPKLTCFSSHLKQNISFPFCISHCKTVGYLSGCPSIYYNKKLTFQTLDQTRSLQVFFWVSILINILLHTLDYISERILITVKLMFLINNFKRITL